MAEDVEVSSLDSLDRLLRGTSSRTSVHDSVEITLRGTHLFKLRTNLERMIRD